MVNIARPARHVVLVLAMAWFAPLLVSPLWAAEKKPAPVAATKPAKPVKPAAKPAQAASQVKADEGFAIGPAPAWVERVAVDSLPEIPQAPLQYLLLDEQTRLDANGEQVNYLRQVQKINSTTALERASQLSITFDPSYQKLTLHEVAVWRDGQRLDRLDRAAVKLLRRETQLERQMIDGRMTATMVLADLRVGDRVEWAASLNGANPVFEGKYVNLQSLESVGGPAALIQRRLLAPAGRTIAHQIRIPGVEVTEPARSDGWHETLVRRRALPQFTPDPRTPPEDFLDHLLEWSEFTSWADVATWAARQFAPALQDHAAVADKAAEIRAASSDPEQRITLALDFVQQQVRYFGTETGASSHRPALARDVLAQRYGDCKDKSALLVNLLSQLDIEATPALVSTVLRRSVSKRLPSPLVFNHAIVAVARPGATSSEPLWLDATRSTQRGPASKRVSIGLSDALLARNDASALQVLPDGDGTLRSETEFTFNFPKLAEPGTLRMVRTLHGDMAEGLRMAQARLAPEAVEKMLGDASRQALTGMEPVGLPRLEEVPDDNALRIAIDFKTDNYWQLSSTGMLSGAVPAIMLPDSLRSPGTVAIQQPLILGPLGRNVLKVHFTFGEPVREKPEESRVDETNAYFSLQWRGKEEARSAEYSGEFRLLVPRVEPAQWATYKEVVQRVMPKLAAIRLNTSSYATDRADVYKAKREELSKQLRSGAIKARGQAQTNAYTRLLALDEQVASARLPAKLLARVQMERSDQLRALARFDEAATALDASLAIDPSNATGLERKSLLAYVRGDDAGALEASERALQLSASSESAVLIRARVLVLTGAPDKAQELLLPTLSTTKGSARTLRAIWVYLAEREQGQDGMLDTADALAGEEKPVWPAPVLRMLRGEITLSDALKQASTDAAAQSRQTCEVYFYAARKASIEKDLKQARAWIDKALETGATEDATYGLALREKTRLK